jgi:hypothetical protein
MLTGHFHKGAGTPVVARRPFFVSSSLFTRRRPLGAPPRVLRSRRRPLSQVPPGQGSAGPGFRGARVPRGQGWARPGFPGAQRAAASVRASKKINLVCRFLVRPPVFTTELGLLLIIVRKRGSPPVGRPRLGLRSAPGRCAVAEDFDHEYSSHYQPDRLLRPQHRLGVGQNCKVRPPSAQPGKAQGPGRPAHDGNGRCKGPVRWQLLDPGRGPSEVLRDEMRGII